MDRSTVPYLSGYFDQLYSYRSSFDIYRRGEGTSWDLPFQLHDLYLLWLTFTFTFTFTFHFNFKRDF